MQLKKCINYNDAVALSNKIQMDNYTKSNMKKYDTGNNL